jgi:hypothetical protein
MALDKTDLSSLNAKKRREKRNQNAAEDPGIISGTIARGLRGHDIDKAYEDSANMIKQYGGNAAKSHGFMAYDKPPASKYVAPTPTPPSLVESRKKIVAKKDIYNEPRMSPGMPKSMDEQYRSEGDVTRRKSGGMIKEGSAKDMREDKVKAKKAGMSMTKWEGSAADKKHDAPKKMATGGTVKKATGGSMRGTGAAVRGKGFSGCY